MDPNRVIIFDTTLRDGEQSPGCTMNIAEKLEIAQALARLGVDVIEAGFPVSSPGDFEAVKRIAEEVPGPIICGLARAIPKDISTAAEALKSAIDRGQGRIHVFIATSQIHRDKKLKMSKEQVIDLAVKSVKFAKTFTPDVEFSCEDAGRTDWDYLVEVITATIEAGATTINIPDTVGYTNPWQFGDCIIYLKKNVKNSDRVIFSVHCHNDTGFATANSIAALRAGCRQAECTINGLGERAGNASLEEVVMHLKVRQDYYNLNTGIKTELLYPISQLVSRITGQRVQANKAIVGRNAFAHEAGIHQDGVLKERTTYEIMAAAEVGWEGESLVLGKHSGRSGLIHHLEGLGFFNLSEEEVSRISGQVKIVFDEKKSISDEELIAIVGANKELVHDRFVLDDCLYVGNRRTKMATVYLKRNGDTIEVPDFGDGSVDAAIKALVKATGINAVLDRYESEALGSGSDSSGRVSIVLKVGDRRVVGRAVDTDLIFAAVNAFLIAINKIIAHENLNRPPQETI